jgi:hypothetical protein
MNTLITAQTIFYLLASVVILAVGLLLVILLYYLIVTFRNTRDLSKDISHSYFKFKGFIETIADFVIPRIKDKLKDKKSKKKSKKEENI